MKEVVMRMVFPISKHIQSVEDSPESGICTCDIDIDKSATVMTLDKKSTRKMGTGM